MFYYRDIYDHLKSVDGIIHIHYNGPTEVALFTKEDLLFLIDNYYREESID